MALAAELVGDRWALLILREAFYGVTRYEDIRADLDAPRSVLTGRLRLLVEQGILEKAPYREEGARTRNAYVLTASGRELALIMMALAQWGEAHITGVEAPAIVVHRSTNKRVRVGLTDHRGNACGLDEVRLMVREGVATGPATSVNTETSVQEPGK